MYDVDFTYMHNKLHRNFHLSNKKALFYNLKLYYEVTGRDPWDFMPITFHLIYGIHDPAYPDF